MPARKSSPATPSAPAQPTKPPRPAKAASAAKPATVTPAPKALKVAKAVAPAKPAESAPLGKPAKPAKAPKPVKSPKMRQRPVRDSFTMPEADFLLIATLKARALAAKRETKKSELLRAGLHALAAMDSATLLAALQALEPIKTGRPRTAH